jgi:hypothetical protein
MINRVRIGGTMSLRRSWRRAAAATVATAATAAVTVGPLLAVPIIASAHAQSAALSSASRPTYQTNGRVSAILVVRNTVYIGGDFTAVRPPGAAPGTKEVSRAHVAAFRVDNGRLRAWNPHPNGSVSALAASSDRRTIYVGGSFTTLAGASRHNLGGVDAKTGSVTGFHANTNGAVLALARSQSRLYVGGAFGVVKHKPRAHVAAINVDKKRLVRSWHAGTNGTVRSIGVTKHGTRVYLGGAFTQINGRPGKYLAKLSSSGDVLTWHTSPDAAVWSVVVGAERVYVGGNGPGGYVSAFSLQGSSAWKVHTDGGVQAMAWFHGALIVGGHFRKLCINPAGHGCDRVLARRNKLVSLAPGTGGVGAWNPSANSGLGVFAVRGAGSKVYVGGVFTKINDRPQQGFDSFVRS